MASYFDVAHSKAGSAPPAHILDAGDRETIGDLGLLSPQVTRILEAMELEDASSSSSSGDEVDDDDEQGEKASLSEASAGNATNPHGSHPVAQHQPNGSQLPKGRASPLNKHIVLPGTPPPSDQPIPKGLKKLTKASKKPADLSRFQSLRTMLFNSHIEENMKKHKAEQAKEDAEQKWKKDFEGRKGLERQPTSEKEKGMMKRMGSKLKRLASKDVQTIKPTREDDDNSSTASSDGEQGKIQQPSKLRPKGTAAENYDDQDTEEEEEINHSDIEDLVRWVSRRDPPSDGETRSKKTSTPAIQKESLKEDSGHESLGHSDVEELVRWVSRRSSANPPDSSSSNRQSPPTALVQTPEEPETSPPEHEHGYSSASTQTDSSGPAPPPVVEKTTRRSRGDTINHDDVDDLVRWVSRREGSDADPTKITKSSSSTKHEQQEDALPSPDRSSSPSEDEDTNELLRWVTRHDDTSGESDVEISSIPSQQPSPAPSQTLSLAEKQKENQGGGSKLREEVVLPQVGEGAADSHASLTHDDVDELVLWVSRKR
ncbi:hypothetical protein DM02DRAFT_725379 [Periconia macrospinosa]|uniref:Uncharacterized protein n=1 Tax=Periconia macrospinosa TaxID=97972 RepID=A0A2V1E3N5_9PLEO|nr:hypothetical protein DM02DRAFT_725379 [Periconia macrospinosa]